MISFSETLPKEKAAYLDFQYVKRLYNEQTTEQIIVRNASSMIFLKKLDLYLYTEQINGLVSV